MRPWLALAALGFAFGLLLGLCVWATVGPRPRRPRSTPPTPTPTPRSSAVKVWSPVAHPGGELSLVSVDGLPT